MRNSRGRMARERLNLGIFVELHKRLNLHVFSIFSDFLLRARPFSRYAC